MQNTRHRLAVRPALLPIDVDGEARTVALVEQLWEALGACMSDAYYAFRREGLAVTHSESLTGVRRVLRDEAGERAKAASELLSAFAKPFQIDHRAWSAGVRSAREERAREEEAERLNQHALSVGAAHARWVKPGTIVRPGARHVFKTPGMAKRFGARCVNTGASW